MSDLYADLINTTGGRLTQAALIDIEAQWKAGEPVKPALLTALETAAAAPGRQGAMARGALVFAAGFVMTIEGQKVTQLLMAALEGESDEAIALRRVLVRNSRLSSNASRTFHAAILRGVRELTGQGHDLTNAAAKIIAPALSILRGEQSEAHWGIGIFGFISIGHVHAPLLGLELVERRRAEAVTATDLRRRHSGFLLLDHPNDLRLGEAAFPHVVCSFVVKQTLH